MSTENGGGKRHHNPVDSLCRKIQTINMLDKTSNLALQIPKLQSRDFDSPQSNVKKNLEEILKKRTLRTTESSGSSHQASFLSSYSDDVFSPCPQTMIRSHRRISDIQSENKTFSIGRNKDMARRRGLPVVQLGSYSSPPFRSQEFALDHVPGKPSAEQKSRLSQEGTYVTSSPNRFAHELKSGQPMFQSPVAKRLSLGWRLSSRTKDHETSDVSLICEEDLLTTIFCACDVDRRGKVAVSTIVDFLRHTTSRCSDDGSLEDLCNMLDPERRDISMDLDTYHAIMKEWIEDCKRNWKQEGEEEGTTDLEEPIIKLNESSLPAKRTPVRMNVTSGSLEALGGDVSKGDLETSDLITCIADLQFNNQKLQEENSQLRKTVDAMEEANNRLTEEAEGLRNQIKSFQQSVAKVKSLKEELEEAKSGLNTSEEKAVKLFTQNKQLEKENQSLILKISSLQEENIRNVLDLDGLQKNIAELSRNVAELQLQVHMYENTLMNKDTSLLKKDSDIHELKSTLKEYVTVVEALRAEKNKLVSNMQQMQQELISNGINFPLIYKFNSSISEGTKSLHCELELAQESSEVSGIEQTTLDESLEREALLLLQGHEQVGEKFKDTIRALQEELSRVEEIAGLRLLQTEDLETDRQDVYQTILAALRQNLASKKTLWLQKLNLLETQKESLDKELIKMVENMRRMRSEQLHLKKELALRQHELQAAKQLQEDAVGEGELLHSALQKLTEQLEDTRKKVKDRESDLHAAGEQARSLRDALEESLVKQGELRDANVSLAHTCQVLEENAKKQSVALDLLREKDFQGLLGRILCQNQSGACAKESPLSSVNLNQEGSTRKNTCCFKGIETQETSWFSLLSRSPSLNWCLPFSPLLDALALDCHQLIQRYSTSTLAKARILPTPKEQHLRHGSLLDMTLKRHKCENCCVACQTGADLRVSGTRMDADLTQEGDAAPLTDVTSSRKNIPSQETCVSASESTEDSTVTEPTLPHPMKETAWEATLVAEEGTMAAAQETKEDELNHMAGVAAGDCTSAVAGSSAAVERSRQKGNFSASPSETEVEAEFLRLSLGFKCDLFTLEKRVRLEKRSRDLAEGNLEKEITSALKLLESLASLSEDNQTQEIVMKLQKSLELLGQHATRVASKAEMLGAIHQAQLNETDGSEWTDKFNRRPSWALAGAKADEKRPSLQRYVSSHSWAESDEEPPETTNTSLDAPAPERRGSKARKLSEKESTSLEWLHSACTRVSSWASSLRTAFGRANKALCVSFVAVVVLAVLSSLLMGLSFQRPADAASVGTGSAWTSVQQLLWPHTGLRHEGPPPV